MAKKIWPCPYCFQPVLTTIFDSGLYVQTKIEGLNVPKEYSHYDCWLEASVRLRETLEEYDNVVNMKA